MTKARDLHERWRRDPDYRAAYDALDPEFELARQLIEAPTPTLPRRGEGIPPSPCRSGGTIGGPAPRQ